jgi:hypothetical protein
MIVRCRLVRDVAGDVFRRTTVGNVKEHNQGTGGSWTTVGPAVSSLNSAAAGNVFAVFLDGHRYEHNVGTGWSWQLIA